MADLHDGVDEATLAAAARHALHDEELVAAFATGDVEDRAEVDRAKSLVDRCTACRDLHADLVAIGTSLHGARMFTAAAPRDFRLTEADALRLGGRVSPRGFVRRLARALGAAGRPLGASMATLGIVGLLVGTLGFGWAGAPGSLSLDAAATTGAGAEMVPGMAPGPSGRITAVGPGATAGRQEERSEQGADLGTTDSSGLVLTAASTILLVGGVALLVVGVSGRRRPQR